LDFHKFKILPTDPLWKANVCIHAKFRVDRWKFWGDMADFRFFQMAAVRYHEFVLRVFGTSVVTTTELSPPPRWLATTEPTLPWRCFTVFSAVFLGAVS